MEKGSIQKGLSKNAIEALRNKKLLLNAVPAMQFEDRTQYFMQLNPNFQAKIISYANTNKENPEIIKLLCELIDKSFDLDKYMNVASDLKHYPEERNTLENFDADTYASGAATAILESLGEKDPDKK